MLRLKRPLFGRLGVPPLCPLSPSTDLCSVSMSDVAQKTTAELDEIPALLDLPDSDDEHDEELITQQQRDMQGERTLGVYECI